MRFLTTSLCALSFLAATSAFGQVRISQIYGAGGNAGATFNSDYVELFNAGAAPASIAGHSIQYAATAGSNWSKVDLTGTIPAGGYFLARLTAAGAVGAAITSDPGVTGSINMSGASGKVALLSNQTVITVGTTCPAGGALLDFVPYGTASCPNPTGTALTAVLAVFRSGGGCTDTDNAASDFTAGLPAPRNSSSPVNACGGPISLSGIGAANPSPVLAGNTTLLTVTVTPATGPASTGITVTGDLSTIGGSASQSFFDNGTSGDVTAGDNIFSFSYTVPGATTAGAKVLPFAVADAQARNANGNLNLTVTLPAVLSDIHTIQGSGLNSLLAGTLVSTTGIVTGVRGDSFYIQNPESAYDADANTSEGIFVFAGSGNVPACAVVGNSIQITGTVTEFTATATALYKPPVGSASLTELESPSGCTILSTGNPLPAPVVINGANLSASAGTAADRWQQLEKFENMRVTTGTLSTTENGNSTTIFATLASVAGPLREAGIQATKYPTGAIQPFFDNNPETFRIEGSGLNGGNAAFDLTYGSTIASVTGILTYSSSDGVYLIRTNAAGVGTQTSSNLAVAPVPVPLATDLTVVTTNAENFTGTDPVKLAKLSATIRTILHNPDIIGFEEMGSDAALLALASQITSDGGPSYSRGIFGAGTQRVAFLYKPAKLQNVNIVEAASVAGNTYINPVNSASEPTFDRVPLMLTATAKLPGSDSGLPVTVVVLHPKSLIDVDNAQESDASGAGRRNQAKRHAGARDTGNLIQTLNTVGMHLFTVGDFNAFQFSDGYVDVTACLKGQVPGPQVFNPLAVASTTACSSYPPANQLINLTDANPAARYSLMFMGNRQSLDHILVNGNAHARLRQVATAYVNSDYPRAGAISTSAARPERYSDHNPHIAYMTLPWEITSQVQIFSSGLVFNRGLGRFTGTITVKNNSAAAIGSPVHVFFQGLPVGVTLANATGTSNGVPYITINTTVAPGQTSAAAAVQFAVAGNVAISYTTKTFSQTF